MSFKIGFWEALFMDVGPAERSAINAAADSISDLHASQADLAAHVTELSWRMQHLEAQSRRLQTVVRVLVDELGGASVLNDAALESKLEAALAALEPERAAPAAKAAPGGGAPYRGGAPAAAPAPEPTERCSRCLKYFAASQLARHERGLLCARCAMP
jgi:hypothetical protein